MSCWKPQEGAEEVGTTLEDPGEVDIICMDIGTIFPGHNPGYNHFWLGDVGGDP